MQSVLDNLCRCFGSAACSDTNTGSLEQSVETFGSADHSTGSGISVPSTPGSKRRTRNLALKDNQWDALFNSTTGTGAATATTTPHHGATSSSSASKKKKHLVTPSAASTPRRRTSKKKKSPPSSSKKSSPSRTAKSAPSSPSGATEAIAAAAAGPEAVNAPSLDSVEQAQSVAKAKLQAVSSRRQQQNGRRKRRRGHSRDDIFRSKKQASRNSNGATNRQRQQGGGFGRFLSKHPVLANSLCFATPIKDSHSDNDDETATAFSMGQQPQNSMVSDTNTLNTVGDETINSTLYYETTKLAGLQQTNPPMPLFNRFQVEDRDGEEIHRIVATRSHSSMCMRQQLQDWNKTGGVLELSDEDEDEDDHGGGGGGVVENGHSHHHHHNSNDDDMDMPHDEVDEDPDASPPDMIHSSSGSTRSSSQHQHHHQPPYPQHQQHAAHFMEV